MRYRRRDLLRFGEARVAALESAVSAANSASSNGQGASFYDGQKQRGCNPALAAPSQWPACEGP